MSIQSDLKENIKQVVNKLYGVSDIEFVVEHPEREEFGDFATNVAMLLARKIKQAPIEIANKVAYELETLYKEIATKSGTVPIYNTIETIAPGFINLKISTYWLHKLLTADFDPSNKYGVTDVGGGKRIALEHSNVNPNKAAHIGHLRNACIGQFIERSYEKQGFLVEVQYYANNVGVQVSTSLMGVQKLTHISPTSYKKFDHYAWDVYSEMEDKISNDIELQNERLSILKKLEDEKSSESIQQKELANKILFAQLESFQQLGFDYDVIIYESDILATHLWEKAFELLKKNPKVYLAAEGKSKGCWLVKLDEKPSAKGKKPADDNDLDIETDKIIVRSNGVPTYTGKDIAYHMWKFGLLDIDFSYRKLPVATQKKDLWATNYVKNTNNKTEITFSNVDYVFNVIGTEQTYAMDVVKRALEYLGFKTEAANMHHVNYGFVFLSRKTAELLGIDVSDGKKFYAMSGRKGWGIKIDDFVDKVDARLTDTYGNFEAIAVVRNGAIKFQMLKLNTFQDLIFDLDEALDLKGYSGPYIQYAYVRANTVLKKSGIQNYDKLVQELPTPPAFEYKELELMRTLYKYAEVVAESSSKFAPNLLCDYLFDLAKKFNTFYNDLSILNAKTEDVKNFRLGLCIAVKNILKDGLYLLGIDVPEKM